MKLLLFFIILSGCASNISSNQDAGISNNYAYFEQRKKALYDNYFHNCVILCYRNSEDVPIEKCPLKCKTNFKQIEKVLRRAINDNKEDDFEYIMQSWYGNK